MVEERGVNPQPPNPQFSVCHLLKSPVADVEKGTKAVISANFRGGAEPKFK
jgi:hypothetical protein